MSITGGNLIYFLKVTALKKPPEEGAVYVPSADVFSATVVVWECLTAQEPYISPVDLMALSPVELMDAVVGGLRPSTGSIPDGTGAVVSHRLQALVESGWHQDPQIRHPAGHSSTLLLQELEEQRATQDAGMSARAAAACAHTHKKQHFTGLSV